MGEFELIERYFRRGDGRPDVVLGSGDDCALLAVPEGQLLAVSTDTLVSGVHFFTDVAPAALGHKALAVNLSDLAAMGAEPRWASMALTLPAIDEAWVAAFTSGFFTLARRHGVSLIGGDITRGPLAITVTIQGLVPPGQALLRSGAKVGDDVYVTGQLGDAALALGHLLGTASLDADALAKTRERLEWPEPRVNAGLALRGLASGALDISDGLASDLGHILEASGVGAEVELSALPVSSYVASLPPQRRWPLAVAGGDDYELCFTVPPAHRQALAARLAATGVACRRIGRITARTGQLTWLQQGAPVVLADHGWDHFKEA